MPNFLFALRNDVASFFEPSIQAIVSSVLNQTRSSHKKISVATFFFEIYQDTDK